MCCAKRRGPRTPSRTPIVNLDCAFVENALLFVVPKLGALPPSIVHTWGPSAAEEERVQMEFSTLTEASLPPPPPDNTRLTHRKIMKRKTAAIQRRHLRSIRKSSSSRVVGTAARGFRRKMRQILERCRKKSRAKTLLAPNRPPRKEIRQTHIKAQHRVIY